MVVRVNWSQALVVARRFATLQSRAFAFGGGYSRMDKIEDIRIEPCTKSKYVQPFRVLFKQNGRDTLWDCVKTHNSLAILIYNKTRNAFVVVKQFRPAVYMSQNRPMWEDSSVFPNELSKKPSSSSGEDDKVMQPSSKKRRHDSSEMPDGTREAEEAPIWGPVDQGFTYELCAGLVDKDLPLEHIAREEVLEETGYDVPVDALERVSTYCSNIGTAGTQTFLFYCEVTDSMLAGGGGGNTLEGEKIEVVYIPVEKSLETVLDNSLPKSSSLCFGFFWFDKYKKPHT